MQEQPGAGFCVMISIVNTSWLTQPNIYRGHDPLAPVVSIRFYNLVTNMMLVKRNVN